MKIDWMIKNEELEIELTPETDGDKLALEYVENFEKVRLRRKTKPSWESYDTTMPIETAYITLKPPVFAGEPKPEVVQPTTHFDGD